MPLCSQEIELLPETWERRGGSGPTRGWLVWLGVLFVCGSLCDRLAEKAQAEEKNPPQQPHILFVLVDDLGWGDFGVFFQNERARQGDRSRPWHFTPALDRLAHEGIQLPHHYCPAPVCAPSRASLLLGVHQGHANIRDNQFDKELEDNHTLGSVLKTAGYRTIAIGKYGLQGGQEQEEIQPPHWPAHPNRRGFDEYYGYIRHRDGHEHYPKEGLHRGRKEVWHNMQEVSEQLDLCYTSDLFTARAKWEITRHVREQPDQPFFMYLAYDTPHAVLSLPTVAYPKGGGLAGGLQWLDKPGRMINTAQGTPDAYYHPDYAQATWDHDGDPSTPEVAWPDVQKRYATIVRRIDDSIADLMTLLQDLGIDENTLIVFTNDNGPSIESYLPERYEPTFFQAYGPYDGIKRDLLEAGVHVGALARWPARIPAGSSSGTHPTQFHDWLPTLVEAAGLLPPARSDGVSLLPLLTGRPEEQPDSTIYVEYFQPGKTPSFADFHEGNRDRRRNQMQLIRRGNLVGLRYDIQSHADPFEIFDIVQDTRQTTNLADSQADLEHAFRQQVLRVRRPNSTAPRPYDDEAVPALASSELPADRQPGLRWHAVEGEFPWVPEISRFPHDRAGVVSQLSEVPADKQPAAYLCSGFVQVPETGEYTFYLNSPGKALLRLHEATLIDGDRGTPAADSGGAKKERVGTIRLTAGPHPFRLTVLHSGENTSTESGLELELSWSGPTGARSPIPPAAFTN